MRVFLAGASGAIGTRLIPQLIDRGHEVIGTFRAVPEKGEHIRALGGAPIALDLLDAAAVHQAVHDSRPDAIIHEATALAGGGFSRKLDRTFAQTNRLRTEGTDALLAAARDAGVRRFVAQSFAPYRYARDGAMVKTEDDSLEAFPAPGTEATFAAMAYVDRTVMEAGGIALRYGGFYGNPDDQLLTPVRKRFFPIIGNGEGFMSFVHLDDAAAATVLALEHGEPGVYNVVDDDPASLREWLPELARVLGAKPPRHIPAWIARVIAGEGGVRMGTQTRGASNAKAKRDFGWTLRYPSWRQGFSAAYTSANATGIGDPIRDSHPAYR
jgi:2-alkyl-3-oxoalkanoate reductase